MAGSGKFSVVMALVLVAFAVVASAAGYQFKGRKVLDEEAFACRLVGTCRTQADCVEPCKELGYNPQSSRCEKILGALKCCCLPIGYSAPGKL